MVRFRTAALVSRSRGADLELDEGSIRPMLPRGIETCHVRGVTRPANLLLPPTQLAFPSLTGCLQQPATGSTTPSSWS